jgi:hypothetical protein
MTGSQSVSARGGSTVVRAQSQSNQAIAGQAPLQAEQSQVAQAPAAGSDVPQALRGASAVRAPDVQLKPFAWAADLRANGSSELSALLKRAQVGKFRQPTMGAHDLRRLPALQNRAPKRDWFFLGMTIRRDQRYKALLEQADSVKNLYEQPPASKPEDLHKQVQDISHALTALQTAIDRYAARASLVRRVVLRDLSASMTIERSFVEILVERLDDPQQPVVVDDRVASVAQLLDYARAGVDVSLAGVAREAGIAPSSAGQAALLAGETLTLAALSLLRYPELSRDAKTAIETLAFLVGEKAYTPQQIDDGLALGLSPRALAINADDPDFKASLAPRRAYLQAFIEAGDPNQQLLEMTVAGRRKWAEVAQQYSKRNVPADVGMACARAGFDPKAAQQLGQVGITAGEIAKADQVGVTAEQLLRIKADQLSVDEVVYQVSRGLAFADALQGVRQLPDDAALGWLREPAADGERLLRSEAAALQQAGIQPALVIGDVMALLDAGVSAAAVARLSQSPPDESRVEALLSCDMLGSQPFSRVEALLLAHAGWPASDDTVKVFRSVYENDALIVPVNEHTVRRDLALGSSSGAPRELGAGALNKVYSVKFQDLVTQQVREGVFKPLQIPRDGDFYSFAAAMVGITLKAPRYELRNVAHARLDQALGFQVVPQCELAVVGGRPGLLMQRVGGTTARTWKTWRPPVDITNTPLGKQLARFAGNSLFNDYAKRLGVKAQAIKVGGRYQILLSQGDHIPPLKPADGEWQRTLIGLQWLHAISGAADSHDENIMRSADGQRYVGIDNDVSFGGGYTTDGGRVNHPDGMMWRDDQGPTRAFHGQGLPPMADQTQFDAIMALNPARLAEELGTLLHPAELKASIKRLEVVQKHLRSLQRAGHVIAPNRWGQESFDIIKNAPESSYVKRQYNKRQELPID